MQRGEVARDDRGGDDGDDEGGAPEREHAGRASEHGASFPRRREAAGNEEPGKAGEGAGSGLSLGGLAGRGRG